MLTYNVNATQAYKRLLKGVVGCIEQRRVVTVGSTLDAFLTRTKKKKKEEEGKRERDDRGKKKKSSRGKRENGTRSLTPTQAPENRKQKGNYGFYSLFKINNCGYTREQHPTLRKLSLSLSRFCFLATTSLTPNSFLFITRETRCI